MRKRKARDERREIEKELGYRKTERERDRERAQTKTVNTGYFRLNISIEKLILNRSPEEREVQGLTKMKETIRKRYRARQRLRDEIHKFYE